RAEPRLRLGRGGPPHLRVLPEGAGLLIVGVDGRELQGRPTGTGRYLRHLLRAWSGRGARVLVYFNGEAPSHPVLGAPGLVARPLPRTRSGLWWSERRL